MSETRPVDQFQPSEDDDELLGVTKVSHNGREPPKRSPGAHVPVNVLDKLDVEPGDRIVWEETSDGGVAFYPVDEDEWLEIVEGDGVIDGAE